MNDKLLLLYNPNAKKGKIEKIIPHITERFSSKYKTVDSVKSESAEHLTETAKENAGKYDCIVVVGGDGSIHNVVNGIKQSGKKVAIGVLPYGTVNDVSRTLHIPQNIDKAIDVILRGRTLQYDIMKAGKDYIVYTLSGGMFVSCSFKTKSESKRIFGRLAYFFTGIGQFFRMRTFPMSFETEEERIHGKYIIALILNTYSTAGFYINGKSSVGDGKMELVLIEKRRSYFLSLLTLARLFLFGIQSVRKLKRVKIISCSSIKIENHSNEPFTADGEKATFLTKKVVMDTPLEFYHGLGY